MSECIFCKIIKGEIPSKTVYEDELVVAFEDINPQAPVHILIVPKEHIPKVDEMKAEHEKLLGHMIFVAKEIAAVKNLKEGYRLVMNNGPAGGQAVFHIHLHLLGGRQMQWPPG